ncbi:MAG: hypothetical protein Q9166_002627 [cf. Caloplaca sp. 2 TL-2023]
METAPGLKIPAVTLADLEHFQKAHFGAGGSTSTPDIENYTLDAAVTHLESGEVVGEEEDDLGYYPDGVKRTLTEEQIAMFRHSEIYSLLRKRQLEKENRQGDEESNTAPTKPEARDTRREDVQICSSVSDMKESLSDFMKFYGPGGETGGQVVFKTPGEAMKDVMDYYDPARKVEPNATGVRKRRRVDNSERRSINQGITSRRQARELDDAVADVGFLDYGEEPSIEQSKSETTAPEPPRRTHVDYAGDSPPNGEQAVQDSGPSKEGRKIWWPKIG